MPYVIERLDRRSQRFSFQRNVNCHRDLRRAVAVLLSKNRERRLGRAVHANKRGAEVDVSKWRRNKRVTHRVHPCPFKCVYRYGRSEVSENQETVQTLPFLADGKFDSVEMNVLETRGREARGETREHENTKNMRFIEAARSKRCLY